jgi:alanine dehydrogenase
LEAGDYVIHKDHKAFEKQDYYTDPSHFNMDFRKYLEVSDVFINGIYWDNRSPAFFALEDMKDKDFNIKVIADITCDIAPDSSVPTTVKASTIADPVYGFNKITMAVCQPKQKDSVDVMAIDNLPNALPRDSSQAFGEKLIKYILPELEKEHSEILMRATITENGHLTNKYSYLEDYVSESVS